MKAQWKRIYTGKQKVTEGEDEDFIRNNDEFGYLYSLFAFCFSPWAYYAYKSFSNQSVNIYTNDIVLHEYSLYSRGLTEFTF
jgi:hypothetical protein